MSPRRAERSGAGLALLPDDAARVAFASGNARELFSLPPARP